MILLLEIEKRNYLSRLAKSLSTIGAGRGRAVEEIFSGKSIKN